MREDNMWRNSERANLIAFRDRLRSKGLAEWTVKSNLMTIVTMLKHNPLKQVTGLLQPEGLARHRGQRSEAVRWSRK